MEIELRDICAKNDMEKIKISKILCGMEINIQNTFMDTDATKAVIDSILAAIYKNTPILFFNRICRIKTAIFLLKEEFNHTSSTDYNIISNFKNGNCSGIILYDPNGEYRYYLEKAMYLPKESYVVVAERE